MPSSGWAPTLTAPPGITLQVDGVQPALQCNVEFCSKHCSEVYSLCNPRLAKTGVSLSDHISLDPACLGQKIRERFGDHLPYLFKVPAIGLLHCVPESSVQVLSVGKALSIQAHPDKAHAEQLHRYSQVTTLVTGHWTLPW